MDLVEVLEARDCLAVGAAPCDVGGEVVVECVGGRGVPAGLEGENQLRDGRVRGGEEKRVCEGWAGAGHGS